MCTAELRKLGRAGVPVQVIGLTMLISVAIKTLC